MTHGWKKADYRAISTKGEMMIEGLSYIAAFAAMASVAHADIEVRFVEGAPKDRFDIINTSKCDAGSMSVTLDMVGSSGGLVFDVTSQGAGVEVFQPFDLVAGGALVRDMPQVVDGDQRLILNLSGLDTDQTVAFTIDVDDTGGGREITVSSAEIAGASVQIKTAMGTKTGTFDEGAMARVPGVGCIS